MGNVQKITIRSTFTAFELIFVAAFIIIGHHIVEVHGVITRLDVPLYIQDGGTTTMLCEFDDNISDLRNFQWSSSFKNTTDRLKADQLLVYNVITKVWSGPATARMEANLDESGFSSTLTIREVDYKLDDKRYWCIMQVLSGSTDANGDTEVTVLDNADNLLWLDAEVGPTLELEDKMDAYEFQCRVSGAKPAPTIVWTLDGDVKGEKSRENKPNADPRLTDSNSTLSVTINDGFGEIGTEKTLSCKATVPEDTVGVSDTVRITRIGESGCVGDDCPGTGLTQAAIIGMSVGGGILFILIVSAVLYKTLKTCNGTPDSNQAEAGDSPMTNTPANEYGETPKQPAKKAWSPRPRVHNIQAVVKSDSEVTLLWGEGKEFGSNIQEFLVEFQDQDDKLAHKWIHCKNTDQTSLDVTNLKRGHTYLFRVTGVSARGEKSQPKEIKKAVELGSRNSSEKGKPDAPDNLTIGQEDKSLVLQWDPPIIHGRKQVSEYNIYKYQGTQPQDLKPILTSETSHCEIKIDDLKKGDYNFIVRAVNDYGESAATRPAKYEMK